MMKSSILQIVGLGTQGHYIGPSASGQRSILLSAIQEWILLDPSRPLQFGASVHQLSGMFDAKPMESIALQLSWAVPKNTIM